MKKIIKIAGVITAVVACTASFKTFKSFFFFLGIALVFSSCGRNVSSGCGTWSYKNNTEKINKMKAERVTAEKYKCPANQYIAYLK